MSSEAAGAGAGAGVGASTDVASRNPPQAASTVHVKIMSPSAGVPADLAFDIDRSASVDQLKALIRARLPSSPSNENQRLIYRGKLLDGRLAIGVAVGATDPPESSYTLHLVVRPPPTPTAIPTNNPFLSLSESIRPSTTPSSSLPPPPPPLPPPVGPATNGIPVTPTTTTSSFQPNGHRRVSTVTTRTTTTTITARTESPFPTFSTRNQPANRFGGNLSLSQFQDELNSLRSQERTLAMLRDRNGLGPTAAMSGTSTGMALPGSVRHSGEPRTRSIGSRLSFSGSTPRDASTGIIRLNGSISGDGRLRDPASAALGDSSLDMASTLVPEETIEQNLDYIEAVRRGERPPVPSGVHGISARRRALQAALQEMEDEDDYEDPLQQTFYPNDSAAAIYPFPTSLAMPSIPENSQVYLLQDPLGRPSALLVGPRGGSISAVTGGLGTGGLAGAGLLDAHLNNPIAPGMHNGALMGNMGQDLNAGLHAAVMPALGGVQNAQDELQQTLARVQQNLTNLTNGIVQEREQLMRNRPMAIADLLPMIRARAGHLWLAAKLTVFVVLLTGNGGWRRMLYLGSIALLIFAWQTGIFNEFLRSITDAINPGPPANANPAAPRNRAAAAVNGNQRQLDPARTARMLIERQQQQGGVRQFMRSAERAAALFIASLIPGLHERHVDAVEQHNRNQRQAAEQAAQEAQQQRQQQRQQQQQQQQQQPEEQAPAPAPPHGEVEIAAGAP